ncbi:Transcription factor MYB27 [Linum perenne]
MAYQATSASEQLRKGPWLEEEDEQLAGLVNVFGERKWDSIARVSGLRRSGKSCRMRWLNYLRPNLKRCRITPEEEQIIIQLHTQWGNKLFIVRWSRIARSLPGRTDNEIKNYWRTHLSKKNAQVQEQEGNFHNNSSDVSDNVAQQDLSLVQDGFVAGSDEQYDLWKLMDSSYETRLYDHWLSEIKSGDQEDGRGYINGGLEESFGGYSCMGTGNYEDGETSVLDCLWEHS